MNAIEILKENRYLKNAIFSMGDNIIKLFIGFFISVMIARYFGPTDLGKLAYVNSFIGIIQIFVILGLDENILTDLGLEPDEKNNIMGTAFYMRLILGIFFYIIGYFVFCRFFSLDNLKSLYLILGINMIFYSIYPIKQWYQINSLNKYIVFSSQIAFFIGVILKCLLVLLNLKFIEYVYLIVLINFLEILTLIYFYNLVGNSIFKWKVSISYAKKLLKKSIPLMFQAMAIYIYMKIDQLMIGKMLGSEQLGVYSVGVNLSELVYFIPMGLAGAYAPKIIELKKNEVEDYTDTVIRVGTVAIAICIIFSLGATFLGSFFVQIVYGERYLISGRIFQIYSWASIFVALGVSHSQYMILEGKQNLTMQATIYGAVINFILNLILIRKIGVYGAAIATIISQGFAAYLYYIFLKEKKYLKIRSRSFIFGIEKIKNGVTINK